MNNHLVPKPLFMKESISSAPVTSTALCLGICQPQVTSALHTRGLFSHSSPTLFERHTRTQAERWAFLENRTWATSCLVPSLPAVGTFLPEDKSSLSHSLVLCVTSHVSSLASTPSYTYHCLYFIWGLVHLMSFAYRTSKALLWVSFLSLF